MPGQTVIAPVRLASRKLKREVRRKVAGSYEYTTDRIASVDPWDRRLRAIHARLHLPRLRYINARWARFSRARKGGLPIILAYRGLWLLWNGHHRCFLAGLRGVRLRARVIELR